MRCGVSHEQEHLTGDIADLPLRTVAAAQTEEMAQGIIEMKEKADLHRMSQNALKYSKENFEKNKLFTQLDSYFNTECPINSGMV